MNFSNAAGVGANLAGTNLSGLNFSGTDLSGANLSGANMTSANLNNAIVTTATNLTGTNLTAQPAHGTLTLNGDGTATYTPNALFLGNDQFTFQIANILTFTANGPVKIQVSL